jgi:hypothetical protein
MEVSKLKLNTKSRSVADAQTWKSEHHSVADAKTLTSERQLNNRKKSATYYEKHKAKVLAKRKERYQRDRERLQTQQREYARKKREAQKIVQQNETTADISMPTLEFAKEDDMEEQMEYTL